MMLGLGHSWVGVFLGCLGEKQFGVMKFRALDFWLFPHFCMSAANAVMTMKLEHLTDWVHRRKNFMLEGGGHEGN